jgi:hypothetical protein
VKLASLFLKAGLHLLLLIAIVVTTTRRDLVVPGGGPDLGAGRTQHIKALVTRHYYRVHCSGSSARRRALPGLPEHCKWGRARIER